MNIGRKLALNITGVVMIAAVISPCPAYAYNSSDSLVDWFDGSPVAVQRFTFRPDFVDEKDDPLIVKTLTLQGLRLLDRLGNTDENFFSSHVRLEAIAPIRIQVTHTGEIAVFLPVEPKRLVTRATLIVTLAAVLIVLAAMLLILLGLMLALAVVLYPSKEPVLL